MSAIDLWLPRVMKKNLRWRWRRRRRQQQQWHCKLVLIRITGFSIYFRMFTSWPLSIQKECAPRDLTADIPLTVPSQTKSAQKIHIIYKWNTDLHHYICWLSSDMSFSCTVFVWAFSMTVHCSLFIMSKVFIPFARQKEMFKFISVRQISQITYENSYDELRKKEQIGLGCCAIISLFLVFLSEYVDKIYRSAFRDKECNFLSISKRLTQTHLVILLQIQENVTKYTTQS